MANWYDRHFKSEYDQDQKALKDSTALETSWQPVAAHLHQMMSAAGFDAGREVALARLRRKATEGTTSTVGVRAVQTVTEDSRPAGCRQGPTPARLPCPPCPRRVLPR